MSGSDLPAKMFVDVTNLARKFWKNFGVTPPTAQKFRPFLNKNKLSILTHHLQNIQTLENQKCIVVMQCIYHRKSQNYPEHRNFFLGLLSGQ